MSQTTSDIETDDLDTFLDDATSYCQFKGGCTTPLPSEGEEGYHPKRKYCTDHQPRSSSGAAKRKLKESSDAPVPPRVTNNFKVNVPKPTKASSETAELEEAITQMLSFVPMILAATGDEVCPQLIQDALPAIAHQLALLAKFHPFIKKVFMTGEGTGEMMAWIGLFITVSPVMIAILAHHDLLKGKVGERIAAAVGMASAVGSVATGEGVSDDTGA